MSKTLAYREYIGQVRGSVRKTAKSVSIDLERPQANCLVVAIEKAVRKVKSRDANVELTVVFRKTSADARQLMVFARKSAPNRTVAVPSRRSIAGRNARATQNKLKAKS